MSYTFKRHGDLFTITYEMVKDKVTENLLARTERDKNNERTSFPTTISIKWLSAYVAKALDIKRNERHWKLHKFVDFALREIAICKDGKIDNELVDNDNNKWLEHLYLVDGLKPSLIDGEKTEQA